MSRQSVLNEIYSLVRRYVVLSTPQADVIALWVVHTHAFAAAETTPYLEICSAEKRSGKTRLLELLDLLCARPWLTGRVTTAVLGRKVDALRPTLLLDESDAAFRGEKDYAEALRAILNSGHRRGGKASVCVGQGANIGFRDLDVFCPKAIAGIGRLPDTISDRAIKIDLRRKARDEVVARFRRRDAVAEATPVKELAEAWANANMEALESATAETPELLNDRAADAWEPLAAIAHVAGGDWPARAAMAARALSMGAAEYDESLGIQLLADIRCVFVQRGDDRVSTADLLTALTADAEAPWRDWRGRGPLTAYILSRTIRVSDESTPKGFKRFQFQDAWKRYLRAPEDRPATPPQLRIGERNELESDDRADGAVAGQTGVASADSSSDVAGVAEDQMPAVGLVEVLDPDAELERLRQKFPDMFGSNGVAAAGEAR
jgi:hypothetical protein